MSTTARPVLHAVVERIGQIGALDAPAKAVGKAVRSALPAGAVKDAVILKLV